MIITLNNNSNKYYNSTILNIIIIGQIEIINKLYIDNNSQLTNNSNYVHQQ